MRCTCCLFMLTLWSAAAGCNNRMPMCIGSFSLHSKWIGLSKRYPNSSVLRRDVESDRLIGNGKCETLCQSTYLTSTVKMLLERSKWSKLSFWKGTSFLGPWEYSFNNIKRSRQNCNEIWAYKSMVYVSVEAISQCNYNISLEKSYLI